MQGPSIKAQPNLIEQKKRTVRSHQLERSTGLCGNQARPPGWRGGVPCDSWRLAVEAYNMRDWKTVPADCEGYAGLTISFSLQIPVFSGNEINFDEFR